MLIYKICTRALWEEALAKGVFTGMPIDYADGYMHFSTPEQQDETLRKHFAGQKDLMLLSVETDKIGQELRWEPARGGQLFPHLYGPLPLVAIIAATLFDAPE